MKNINIPPPSLRNIFIFCKYFSLYPSFILYIPITIILYIFSFLLYFWESIMRLPFRKTNYAAYNECIYIKKLNDNKNALRTFISAGR